MKEQTMYVFDPLSQEQLYVPEMEDHEAEVRAREHKKEKRIERGALIVFAIFCILLFVVAVSR
jgi:cytochrome b